MKLYIVRHGETIANEKKIIQGQRPGRLTPQGRKQAEKLGQLLEVVNFDIIYCSDLTRTKDTLKKIIPWQISL